MRQFDIRENPKEVIEAARRGDASAFECLYTSFFAPVYRYVFLRVKDKAYAEEITQDVFIRIWNAVHTLDESKSSPLALFYTVARNLVIDHWRKNRDQVIFGKEDILLQTPSTEDTPLELAEKNELTKTLYKYINELPHEQRQAIVMRYLEDIPNRDIGELLGKSEEAVRQMQSRGIRTLRGRFN